MGAKVGALIRQARTDADMTQEKLARKVGGGLTAQDVSRAERGELDLSQAVLRDIARATGVTQASLVEAAKAEKASAAKKTATKKTAEKKAKTPDAAGISMRVTATEKRLIEAYRLADGDAKRAAMKLLRGDVPELVAKVLGGSGADAVTDMLGDAISRWRGDK
ncbi:MAG: helix-turn-helix transcriptional regulator [Aristaeellaceae bacterium]